MEQKQASCRDACHTLNVKSELKIICQISLCCIVFSINTACYLEQRIESSLHRERCCYSHGQCHAKKCYTTASFLCQGSPCGLPPTTVVRIPISQPHKTVVMLTSVQHVCPFPSIWCFTSYERRWTTPSLLRLLFVEGGDPHRGHTGNPRALPREGTGTTCKRNRKKRTSGTLELRNQTNKNHLLKVCTSSSRGEPNTCRGR